MRILLVEDNEDHALITEMAIQDAQPDLSEELLVTTVSDGMQALDHLNQAASDGGDLPDLILLDMKMPGLSGLDVLKSIREDDRLRTVPVIMLTTSAQGDDVRQAYRLGANEYVTKPVRSEEFRTKVQAIPTYWSRVVQRPPLGRL